MSRNRTTISERPARQAAADGEDDPEPVEQGVGPPGAHPPGGLSHPPDAPPKKRKRGTSPTARSLAYARSRGWAAGVVERWNQHAMVRHDLFGFIDLVVLDDMGDGPLAVQACAATDHAKRRAKVAASPLLPRWLAQPGRCEVWSWSKRGARGKRKLWDLRREAVLPEPAENESW